MMKTNLTCKTQLLTTPFVAVIFCIIGFYPKENIQKHTFKSLNLFKELTGVGIGQADFFYVDEVLGCKAYIAASVNPVCFGISIISSASPISKRTTPKYPWKLNELNVVLNSTINYIIQRTTCSSNLVPIGNEVRTSYIQKFQSFTFPYLTSNTMHVKT